MPVMSDNSGNRASKMSLPEWDHTVETLLFDRANESLRIRRPNDSNGTAVIHFWSRSQISRDPSDTMPSIAFDRLRMACTTRV